MEYSEGYYDGQDDALRFLKNATNGETPFVAIYADGCFAWAMWTLGHNLAIAGALHISHERGWWDGAGFHKRHP